MIPYYVYSVILKSVATKKPSQSSTASTCGKRCATLRVTDDPDMLQYFAKHYSNVTAIRSV